MSPTNNHSNSTFNPPQDIHQLDANQPKKRPNPSEALILSTAPEDPPTHWQQVQLVYAFIRDSVVQYIFYTQVNTVDAYIDLHLSSFPEIYCAGSQILELSRFLLYAPRYFSN